MKIRIIDIGEMILALAVGMALIRECHGGDALGSLGPRFIVEPMLVGVSLTAAIGLGYEALTRTIPRQWGIGRWTVAVTGIYIVIDVTSGIVMNAALALHYGKSTMFSLPQTFGLLTTLFYGQLCWMLLACWIVHRFTGWLRDPQPDCREHLGRCLLAAIILWGFAYRVNIACTWR